MGRPPNWKLAKRKQIGLATEASLAKRRRVGQPELDPPPQLPEATHEDDTRLTEESTAVEAIEYLEHVESQETTAPVIEPDLLINADPNVAAVLHHPEALERFEDDFSQPDAPEEPDNPNVDPQPPEREMPNPVNPQDTHDALVEEQQRIEASIAAVAAPSHNTPLAREVASIALEKLEVILCPSKANGTGYKPPKLDSMFSIRQLTAMAACLRFYCNSKLGWSFTYSSEIAALGTGYGQRFGKNLRRFIRAFVNTDQIPENQYGTWNASVLEDEDLATELKEYLVETKGKYMKAQDIIEYLELPDVKRRFNLDEPPTLRTAQRWIKEFGFRWGSDPKGQYIDGHEREDVVKYRNEQYIATWNTLENRMRWYDSKTMEEFVPTLQPGERMVMVWFHDESIFYANDRRLTRWVHFSEKAKPYAKGEGASVMVADFVGIDGWLYGANPSDNARVVLFPGKTRDGYLTGEKVRNQLKRAMAIVKTKYPDADHVFVYDNATTHTKRREDLAIISKMPLRPSENVGEVVDVQLDDEGKVIKKIRARYADTHFPDGSPQSLYFPDDHPDKGLRGWFKGIAEILRERDINVAGLKLVCKAPKKCTPNTRCCARQLLSEQPGFEEQQSALEEIAEEQGCRLLFLPKFHCELNPIEQCWGYAKRVYRQFPASKSQATLRSNMLASLDSIPLDTIRRFFNKSYRYLDAYRHGLDGQAAAWANKKYRGHRTLPPNIVQEIEAEFRRRNPCIRPEPPP